MPNKEGKIENEPVEEKYWAYSLARYVGSEGRTEQCLTHEEAASKGHAPLVGKGEETAEIQTKQYLRAINFIPKFRNYSCIPRDVAIYRFFV